MSWHLQFHISSSGKFKVRSHWLHKTPGFLHERIDYKARPGFKDEVDKLVAAREWRLAARGEKGRDKTPYPLDPAEAWTPTETQRMAEIADAIVVDTGPKTIAIANRWVAIILSIHPRW